MCARAIIIRMERVDSVNAKNVAQKAAKENVRLVVLTPYQLLNVIVDAHISKAHLSSISRIKEAVSIIFL